MYIYIYVYICIYIYIYTHIHVYTHIYAHILWSMEALREEAQAVRHLSQLHQTRTRKGGWYGWKPSSSSICSQFAQFELSELIIWFEFRQSILYQQFEPTVSQSAVSSLPLKDGAEAPDGAGAGQAQEGAILYYIIWYGRRKLFCIDSVCRIPLASPSQCWLWALKPEGWWTYMLKMVCQSVPNIEMGIQRGSR